MSFVPTRVHRPSRHVAVALVAALALALVALAQPAQASNSYGRLQVRGTGSTFAGSQAQAAIATVPGGAPTYTVKVVNRGSDASAYWLLTTSDAQATVTTSGFPAKTVQTGLGTQYITPVIPAGGSLIYTIKVKVPNPSPQRTYFTAVNLFRDVPVNPNVPEYAEDTVVLRTEVRPPSSATGWQLLARNGSLAYVGGTVDGQMAGGPALKVGSTSTFTVVVKNGTSSAGITGLSATGPESQCPDFSMTIKTGGVDVTAAVEHGGYSTPTIAKGATKSFTVTVKRVSGSFGCLNPEISFLGAVRVYLGAPGAVA